MAKPKSQSSKNLRSELPQLFERWSTNPVLFASEMFGIDTWEAPPESIRHAPHGQSDILRSVGHTLTAVMSGRKTGKSTGLILRGIHWMMFKERPSVTMTAPTFPQVEKILWKELNRVLKLARYPLGGRVYETPNKGWVTSRGSMFGRTSNTAEGLQGPSGADQLYLVDEMSGYSDALLQALIGNLAGGGEFVGAFNPTQTVGLSYDAYHSKAAVFNQVNLSSLDVPNMTGIGKPARGLMDPAYCATLRELWGEDTAAWQVHVLGQFPTGSVNTIITLGAIEKARVLYSTTEASGVLSIGVDVAGFGDDDSVIVARRGLRVIGLWKFRGIDGPDLAGEVRGIIGELRAHGEKPKVKVDVTGEGASCFDTLLRFSSAEQFELYGINNASAPTSIPIAGPGYANLGCQLWFSLRSWFAEGGAIPDDRDGDWGRLQGELTGRVYQYDAQGRYQLEPKKEFKKRIGRSPDRADALTLCVYDPPSTGEIRVRGQRKLNGRMGGF